MIQLPPGFDYNQLYADFISFFVPLVPIICVIVVYGIIKKAGNAL
ncbi:hypothetical protein [Geobacter sp. FeAm09]|nr:hypothetical protein [Geobacter sp. FeAm09]